MGTVGRMGWVEATMGLVLLGPMSVAGQEASAESRSLPTHTVTLGVGNAMGWTGAQGERYFRDGRLSAFLGLGHTFRTERYDPSGATFAAGVRGFTSGRRHRGLLELSVSQLAIWNGFELDGAGGARRVNGRQYGPGLAAGYQFVGKGGFTLLLATGAGYALNDRFVGSWHGLLNIGFGYTWRGSGRRAAAGGG